jgi:hypothetical protein
MKTFKKIALPSRYRVETVTTPHSTQRAFCDVINPHAGHILCDRTPVICGINLRIQRSSSVMRNRVNRPTNILVAFIKIDLSSASSASTSAVQDRCGRKAADSPLAEKPKEEELQMSWLRSEDLKEEKNVTASIRSIAGEDVLHFGVPQTNHRLLGAKMEHPSTAPSIWLISVTATFNNGRRATPRNSGRAGPFSESTIPCVDRGGFSRDDLTTSARRE